MLEGCPWSFDKNIIVLSQIRASENLAVVDLNWCDFYIYIYNLSLNMMNLGVATLIGNRLGKFRDMDMDAAGCSWSSSMRVRIGLNVNVPLTHAI
ncbi:hypothetical protein Sango_1732500 [Sesamum angolense]|uniref:DUF4283 domain-containing protein n=1 Tax=Sesamum angolense TaxID=2727404 RepID=A0AAE1WLS6_9LAMI|nr:hypothetical protein Sango_1732500 [Sesamum angolense]